MSARRRTIELAVAADIARYQKEMAKIPGVTEKQAGAAARKWADAQNKIAVEAAKSQAKMQAKMRASSEDAASQMAKAWEHAFGFSVGSMVADTVAMVRSSVVEGIRDVMQQSRMVVDVAEDTGLLAEQVDAVRLAYVRAGEDAAGGLDALRDFGEMLFDFSNGGGRAEEAMTGMGISVLDANGQLRAASDVLPEVIAKMQALESDTLRVAYAQQLAGDDGARLMRVLGDRSLEEHIAFAREYGVRVGPDAARATRDWTNATGDLRIAGKSLISEVLDVLGEGTPTEFVKDFTRGFVALSKFWLVWQTESVKAWTDWRGKVVTAVTGGGTEGLVASLADLVNPFDEIADAAHAALVKVGALNDMQRVASEQPLGAPGSAGAGGTEKAKEALASLAKVQQDMVTQHLEGVDAINATYDRYVEKIKELGAASRDEAAMTAALDEAEMARIIALADVQEEASARAAQKASEARKRSAAEREREAAEAAANRERALEHLTSMQQQLVTEQLEGLDAINAKWDVYVDQLLEAGIQAESFANTQYTLHLAEMARTKELSDFKVSEAQRVASEVSNQLERERQDRARVTAAAIANEQAKQDAARSAVASGIAGVAGLAQQIMQMDSDATSSAAKGYRERAEMAKRAAVFDLIIKEAQALATVMSSSDPYSAIGFMISTGAAFIGLMSSVQAASVPSFGQYHAGGSPMIDERFINARVGEVVVSAPSVREAGGPSGVRDKLAGSSSPSGPSTFVLEIGRRQIPLLARELRGSGGATSTPNGWRP